MLVLDLTKFDPPAASRDTSSMKFPITRESLQAYDCALEHAQKQEEYIRMQIATLLSALCKDFEREMPSNQQEKKFKWRDIQHRISMTRTQKDMTVDCLPHLINKIKETFVGCDVQVDAFKTHIIIDWS